jgi:hypothetical protein
MLLFLQVTDLVKTSTPESFSSKGERVSLALISKVGDLQRIPPVFK